MNEYYKIVNVKECFIRYKYNFENNFQFCIKNSVFCLLELF